MGPPRWTGTDAAAGAGDGDREPAGVRPNQSLGLELRLLVGVAVSLPDVEVLLRRGAASISRDVRRRDVVERPQSPAMGAQRCQLEHPPRPLDVDRARLRDAQSNE